MTIEAPASWATPTKAPAFGSSALTIAVRGQCRRLGLLRGPGAASRSNSDSLASRYASHDPWNSRCSWLRFVRIAASYATARTRSVARPWDVVSRTTARLPAPTIARRACWRSGAPGVVRCSAWASRPAPIFVSTVPISPVESPAASSAATARNDVVVLPSVPVIPMTPSSRLGSPYHHAAASARAARDEGDDELRHRALGDGALDERRRGAARLRVAQQLVAVDVLAPDRDEQGARSQPARVVGDAADPSAASAAGPIARPPSRAPTAPPAAVSRATSSPSGRGSLGFGRGEEGGDRRLAAHALPASATGRPHGRGSATAAPSPGRPDIGSPG